MGLFGHFKKQLKKKLRLKRRWLTLGVILLAVGLGLAYIASENLVSGSGAPAQSVDMAAFLQQRLFTGTPAPLERAERVTLRRIFVCGEEERFLGELSPEEVAAMAAEHPEWELQSPASGHDVVFLERVDDLSEECKSNSYFGIDEAGNLTLFRGLPKEEQTIKTFFQLDIEYLESSMPEEAVKELRNGIRVADLDEYNSVISTFSDFAVEEVENVMNPSL